jgi:hypothetical protein
MTPTKNMIFYVVMMCSSERAERFGGVNYFFQSAHIYNPEDCTPHSHHYENLKSTLRHLIFFEHLLHDEDTRIFKWIFSYEIRWSFWA